MGGDQGPESCGKEPLAHYEGTYQTVRGVKLGRDRVSDAVSGKDVQKVREEQQPLTFGVWARGRHE